MVKDPDRLLSLAYAGAGMRLKLQLAFALDEALAAILQTVYEPMIAQIRLAWWRDQLSKLGSGNDVAAEPLLCQIGTTFAAADATMLAELPSAWEHLLEDPLTIGAISRFAEIRGAALAAVLGDAALTKPLTVWAMSDFCFHCSNEALAKDVRAAARALDNAALRGVPRPVRVLVGLARDDLALPEAWSPGSPRRVWRAFRHAVLTS